MDFYDAELRAHHEHLRAAYGISPGDRVLDIGCGAGLTTRDAARAAAPGEVLGVDVSERMLELARQRTAAEGLDNVRYELGDAQVHRFDPAGFDVAISRFGTMFFSDPGAAFANLAAALRPEGRLVLLVWQRREDNEWMKAFDAALGAATPSPPPPDLDAFSLGDAEATARVLEAAGFTGVRFEDVREPVFYGHDLDAALAIVRGFSTAALARLSDDEAARGVERLRETLAAHYTDEHGVALASRSWLITARRVNVEVREIRRSGLGRQCVPQPIGKAVWVEERAEPVAEPRVGRGALLLEEEVDLDRAVAEPDEGVRSLPRHFVEPAEPPAEPSRDRAPFCPQLLQPARLSHHDEVDVGTLIRLTAGERPLQQQRADAWIALGPAPAGVDDRFLTSDGHGPA